MRVVNSSHFFV